MTHRSALRHPSVVLAPIALCGMVSATGVSNALTSACAYITLALLPGVVVCQAFERRPSASRVALAALTLAPVLTGALATVLMVLGGDPATVARALLVASGLLGIAAVLTRPTPSPDPTLARWRLPALVATVLFFCALAGYLPLTREAWRYWSDAWFHNAVLAQIDTFGIPPEDPYFAGLDLQYMWFYHVVVLALARGAALAPQTVMPLLNMQALAGLCLATFLLSTHYRKRFTHGWFAVVTVVLSMNALIWLFLPLKLVTAFTGEVRGWAEIQRTYSLVPFDHLNVRSFLRVWFNQPFLINKFIVMTAFSLGVASMAAFWYFAVRYLSSGVGLVALVIVSIGIFVFHPVVGFIMTAGACGGAILVMLCRRRISDFSRPRLLRLVAAPLSGLLLVAPYLYSVMHLKESEQLSPIGFSFGKTAAIVITCAAAVLLAAFQVKRLLAARDTASAFLVMSTLALVVVCNLIVLPGPNLYDKPPHFVFYPLALVGGWTFADRFARRHASRRYRLRIGVLAALLLVPVNALALSAYYASPTEPVLSDDERAVAAWVRAQTRRDAIFIDSDANVFLLVAGPRRYYFGRVSYALQWGYPKDEMGIRRHVRDNLYSPDPLDPPALEALAGIDADLYVIVRDDAPGASGLDKFEGYPALFERRFSSGAIHVLAVDREACREAATRTRKDPHADKQPR